MKKYKRDEGTGHPSCKHRIAALGIFETEDCALKDIRSCTYEKCKKRKLILINKPKPCGGR